MWYENKYVMISVIEEYSIMNKDCVLIVTYKTLLSIQVYIL